MRQQRGDEHRDEPRRPRVGRALRRGAGELRSARATSSAQRLLARLGGQHAGGDVGLDLAALAAQHLEVRVAARTARRRARARSSGHEHERQRHAGHQRGQDPEDDHRGVAAGRNGKEAGIIPDGLCGILLCAPVPNG